MPYREIAEELTDRKIPAPRGGAWNAMTVMSRNEAAGDRSEVKKDRRRVIGGHRDVTADPRGGKRTKASQTKLTAANYSARSHLRLYVPHS